MKNQKFTFEELSKQISGLIQKKWIHYSRTNEIKHDGMLGNVLEDLLGVEENNLKAPDFGKWEIKSKNEETTSRITLFNVKLSHPDKANTKIRENFGSPIEGTKHKEINTTISLNHWTATTEKYKYTYMLKLVDDKLRILIKNKETQKILDDLYYWDLEKIRLAAITKISHLCYVKGEINKSKKKVKFNSAEVYSDFKFEKLIELLKSRELVFEFRIGIYRSGEKKGKSHDHGSAFRINKDSLYKIYNKHKKI